MNETGKQVNNSESRVRLLKPSIQLYFVVGTVILTIWIALLYFLTSEYFDLLVVLLLLSPLGLVAPVAFAIAKSAEMRKSQPGNWLAADVKREIRRYGPLRANRLFGHPIGRGKKKGH